MDFDARKSDIAREIALELKPEFGEEIVAETEKRLSEQGTRGFGVTPSDAAAVAGLILGCIQLALQYVSDKRMDELFKTLKEEAPKPPQISEEKRDGIIQRIAAKFSGQPNS